MNPISKPNYFIFTGGPGAGKTTLLNELQQRGYLVVPEAARAIIKEQNARGGNATHNGNRKIYCDLMLEASIDDYLKMLPIIEKIVFFDRGIPDLYSYSHRFCGGVSSEINQAVTQYRYNTTVFLFPPWEDIYCHDSERKQDFHEAIETCHAVKKAYSACGYSLIEIPKTPLSERADFILKMIGS